jgi:hypothetical protein
MGALRTHWAAPPHRGWFPIIAPRHHRHATQGVLMTGLGRVRQLAFAQHRIELPRLHKPMNRRHDTSTT